MKCLLLGEGPSDLGSKAEFPETGIQKGPMTIVIDCLAASQGVYEIAYKLLSRVEVSKGLKASNRMIASRPKIIDKGLDAVFKSAWYLGTTAKGDGDDFSVYFHDADHTNSGSGQVATQIEKVMRAGFDFSGFSAGVPMVPNPRSEAWLLAYFQKGLPKQREYNKADQYENLPANDDSPKSAKKLLQKAIGAKSASEVYPIVMERIGEIDWKRVDMSSYNRFRERLEAVLDECLAAATATEETESFRN